MLQRCIYCLFFVRICAILGGGTMYHIMNKDRIIAGFEYVVNELGTAVPQLVSGCLPKIYGDMKLKN